MSKGKYLGYVISAAIVIFILFTFDWKTVGAELRDFDYLYLLPALALFLLGYVFRALRWQCMLAPLKKVSFNSSFIVIVVGFMANNILPLRMGEFVRAWAIKKKEGISASAGFATIVIERVYDGLTLVGLFALMLLFFKTARITRICGFAGAAIFLFVLALLLYAVFHEERARGTISRLMRLVPEKFRAKADGVVDSFITGLHFLSSGRTQAVVIIYSFLIWILEGSVFLIIMKGFHLPVPSYAAFFTLVVVNIAIMIPAMPGYVGTFEGAAVLALAPFGVGESAAIGYILVVHALQYITVTGLGLFFMNMSGWSLREIEEAEKL